MTRLITRRSVLAGLGFSTLIGSTAGLVFSPNFREIVLGSGEKLAYGAHRLIGRTAMAPEFTEADLSPDFRTNGNTMPRSDDYQRHMDTGFANWALRVDGLVATPMTFTLATLKAMPSRLFQPMIDFLVDLKMDKFIN